MNFFGIFFKNILWNTPHPNIASQHQHSALQLTSANFWRNSDNILLNIAQPHLNIRTSPQPTPQMNIHTVRSFLHMDWMRHREFTAYGLNAACILIELGLCRWIHLQVLLSISPTWIHLCQFCSSTCSWWFAPNKPNLIHVSDSYWFDGFDTWAWELTSPACVESELV